jgi:hypothetical protein
MKVRNISTGGIQESANDLVIEQWRKHSEYYEELPDNYTPPKMRGKRAAQEDTE